MNSFRCPDCNKCHQLPCRIHVCDWNCKGAALAQQLETLLGTVWGSQSGQLLELSLELLLGSESEPGLALL